jgi:hypothetical protein
MNWWPLPRLKGRRAKVRRMGNFSNWVEFYLYILMAIVILGALFVSFSG